MENTDPTILRRRYDIDAIRVLAFGLLILYHLGMFYVADWGWHVKSSHSSERLQLLMLLVNQWRMPLLFLISGAASWFLFRKLSAARFAGQRLWRLLLPLLFGMLVVVPPQAYVEALANGAIAPGYTQFLAHYLSFRPWPTGAFTGSTYGITWNHLWYLPYLICYTLALIPLALWLRPREEKLLARLARLNGWALILLPLPALMLYGLVLYPRFGGINHALAGDWYAHAQFFTFFMLGYGFAGSSAVWRTLAGMRWHLLLLSPLLFALLLIFDRVLPDNRLPAQSVIAALVTYANRWCWILAVLAWGHQLLNRPFRWLPYANEAVFPWYILHQSITVTAGYYLAQRNLGPVLEPLLLLTATVGGCLLLHELVIRRTPLLRPLFGLKPLPAVTANAAGEQKLIAD
ncbi:acyltransferase family protein [Microbulbifer sp. SAOS-129_SWC]|uniref:acyltransferase family protein n=1 Tax=Microbulbifer sp. SAOS-129_SWC TaxID=3145235 RepID=UPI0032176C2C